MTKLQLLNYIIQFLCIRIYRQVDQGKTVAYGILYFIVPLTGWINPFWAIGEKVKSKRIYRIK
ncbi:MAG: hypothetical protein EOO20_16110 [Chryseobacterium sp.]|nr:MAG: hypothetical protein EOO20_16110 [Chryseobacterium sp.]